MIPAAFYAPLKAPDHPNPSGDRELARALLQALDLAGFAPSVASDLRLFDKTGADQEELCAAAEAALPDVIAQGRATGWRLWVTYHNYYKAPDLLGPPVCAALGIPYVQIESTRAKKRLTGPWAGFAAAAEAAADAADVIFYFTQRDSEALRAYAPSGQQIVHLSPFLPRADLPPVSSRNGSMLAVAMMRPGDKLASYSLLAEALAHVRGDWRLDIAGDGTARAEVEALMRPFGTRVRFLGQLSSAELENVYAQASVLVWPGVNEAIGLTYLEAQAAGIPVLAQDRPGLRDVIAPELPRPSVEDGAPGYAAALEQVLLDPPTPEVLRAHVSQRHLLSSAAETLRVTLSPIVA